MTYDVGFAAPAAKALAKLDKQSRLRIAGAIELLGVDPRPPAAKQLRGGADVRWRLRVGDYRVVYAIQDQRLLVLVLRVAHRREAYRTRRNAATRQLRRSPAASESPRPARRGQPVASGTGEDA